MTLLMILLGLGALFIAVVVACHLILAGKARSELRASGTGWTPEKEERLHSALSVVLERAFSDPDAIHPEAIRDAYEADRAKSAGLVDHRTDINAG